MSVKNIENMSTLLIVLVLIAIASLLPLGLCIKCVQCQGEGTLDMFGNIKVTDRDKKANISCVSSPPAGSECLSSMRFCLTATTYQPNKGTVTVIRSCAPVNMVWDCPMGAQNNGLAVQVCHQTCATDNCNSGERNSPNVMTQLLLSLVVTKVLAIKL